MYEKNRKLKKKTPYQNNMQTKKNASFHPHKINTNQYSTKHNVSLCSSDDCDVNCVDL